MRWQVIYQRQQIKKIIKLVEIIKMKVKKANLNDIIYELSFRIKRI